MLGLVELKDYTVLVVFLEAMLGAEGQHFVEGGVAQVDLGLAGGEQQVEERKGRRVSGEVQDDAGGENAAAQVEVEIPGIGRILRVGAPAGCRVAVDGRCGVARVGAGFVDAAAEGREVSDGIDVAAHGDGREATAGADFDDAAGQVPGVPVAGRVEANFFGEDGEGEKQVGQINAGSFEFHLRVSSALGSCRI